MNAAGTIRYGTITMAVAALCALFALPAYAAYEDSLKGYWKMDDLSADDNFTGSGINTSRWNILTSGNGAVTPTIINNQLDLKNTNPTQQSWSYIQSNGKWTLSGDFDVRVDWSGVTLPNADQSVIRLQAYVNEQNYFGANYRTQSGTDINHGFSYVGGSYGEGVTNQDGLTAGALRITRSGSTITTYNQNGQIYTRSGFSTGDVSIRLALISDGGSYPSDEIKMDNFTVTNGEHLSDSKGSNTGTIYGATQTTGKTGYNTALYFDGTDDYVKVSPPSDLPLGNTARTIEGWIYKTGTASEMGIIQYGTSAAGEMCGLITSANAPGKLYFYGHAQDLSTNADIPLNEWTHVAMTYDGSLVSLYMNGELDISAPRTLNTVMNSDYLTIGLRPGIGYFQGGMDDFAIFNRALDANEIGMLYDLGTEKFEWLTVGVNDADALNLGYTTSELKLLADLYAEGDTGASETIEGMTWHYLSGDLPGDIGGTTYDYGDTWIYDGKYYLKLGSGLEGSAVPEPGCAFGLFMGFFVPGFQRLFKRRVRG